MDKGKAHAAGRPDNPGGPPNTSGSENSELLGLALRAALEGGAEILEVYNSDNFDVSRKADDSPLTLADRWAHEVIESALQETGIPLLSEEGAQLSYEERARWGSYWLVDPLDGTKEFIKRNGEFTVNIALMAPEPLPSPAGPLHSSHSEASHTPAAGVVYVPVKDILYAGLAGEGAWKLNRASALLFDRPDQDNREKCQNPAVLYELLKSSGSSLPSEDPDSRPFSAVVSRSHNSPETEELMDELEGEYGPAQRVSSGSSIKLCLVAEGTADVYPRFAPTMEWDTAAGDAVCRAAGCAVTQKDRKTPLRYNKEDLHNPWFVVLGPRLR
ncbi:MAG: 3'(2'),5'-bisphosphate nucleotidase CysQ [Spirochaetaceae bacterium]